MALPSYHQHSTFNDRSQIREFNEPSRRILLDPSLRAFTYRKDHPRGFVLGLRQWKLQGRKNDVISLPLSVFSFQYPVSGESMMSTFSFCLKCACLTKNFLSNLVPTLSHLPLPRSHWGGEMTDFLRIGKKIVSEVIHRLLILVFRSLWQRTAKSCCFLW